MQNQSFTHNLPIIYRPYNFPSDFPILAFLGNNWKNFSDDLNYLHFHNALEIGLCTQGKGILYTSSMKPLPVQKGDILLLYPQLPHFLTADGGCVGCEYIYIDPKTFFSAYQTSTENLWQIFYILQNIPPVISAKSFPEISGYISAVFDEFHAKKVFFQDAIYALMYSLLSQLNMLPYSKLSDSGPEAADISYVYIKTALSYIHTHYSQPLSIAELAEACAISESHLRRLFKQVTGISPLEYIQHYRIQQVCNLLRFDSVPINLAASRVGFQSLSSFNRQFQQCMNMSPRAWVKSREEQMLTHEVSSYEDSEARQYLQI